MKKVLLLILCLFAAGAAYSAQGQEIVVHNGRSKTVKGSGVTVTENFDVAAFAGISASSGVRVEVVRGEKGVKVETDSKALDYLKVSVSDGVLRVGYKNNVTMRNIRTTFYISVPELESLRASSGATVRLDDAFGGDSLSVDTSSAGSVSGEVDYAKIDISASSGAVVRLKGKAKSGKASGSSGASVDLLELVAGTMEVGASSGASVRVNATESLTGKASSGASVKFAGDPKNIDIRKSSGGSATMLR